MRPPTRSFYALFLISSLLPGSLLAQQASTDSTLLAADSALMDRVSALEKEVAQHKPGEDHFMVVGLTTFGFFNNKTVNTVGGVSQTSKTSSLGDAGDYEFSPMFLWRHGNKWLMEFEPSFNNDGLSVNWADVSYFAAPGLIIRAGYLVIPFGTYNKREAAGWIDKFATDPLGIPDLPPNTDYGVEVEGGLPLGNMKWSYDVALTNGMQLQPDGELQGTGINDNNLNRTVSGRLALLPFSNSCLELGVSGLYGNVNYAGSGFNNANTDMFAADLNYVHTFNPILVNVKAQYDWIHVNPQTYVEGTQNYTFTNSTKNGFAQVSVRPTLSNNPVLKNFELGFRYANLTTPANSAWGSTQNQYDIGLEYWLSWRTVLKATYEITDGNSTVNQQVGTFTGTTDSYTWYLQCSIQL